MGIAEQMGWSNPFTQFVGDNRRALMGFGAGLASGQNLGQGIANGLHMAGQGAEADEQRGMIAQAEEERQQQINQTAAFLRSKGAEDLAAAVEGGMTSGSDAFNAWYQSQNQAGPSPMEINGQLVDPSTGQVIGDYRDPQGVGGDVTYGVNPIYGRLPDGTMGMGVLGDDGTLKAVDTGGMTPLGPYDTNALKAAGTAYGRSTGGAQFDLPAAQLTTQQTLDAIQSVRNQAAGMEEQFGNILGVPQQMLPTVPQSERANFQVETNRLINRTFLEAREVLRGGGQITDFESRKAEGAISNLEEAMARGDKALFQKSLNDLEQAVRDGYAKLETQAGVMPNYGGGGQQQSMPSASGQVLTYNPATGRLE